MSEVSELSSGFIGARQGFDQYVKSVRETDPNIVDPEQAMIDMNLTGMRRPTDFDSFPHIADEYQRLKELSRQTPGRRGYNDRSTN